MKNHDLEHQMEQLERALDAASTRERLKLAPHVQQITCRLGARHQPIPRRLQSIQKVLEQEAFDDMFDNMPV
ncbi:hypothetical protein HKX54_12950 [Sulfitobacter sp. M57]|uniref:hypothetical protein n=1 Tax=unclassified Sulfitobacter TaxID=196795 RepID=UPI0023E0C05D|nr:MULTISPECIES: hypothetical protein [unclassified Sulfitobacter]MDF3415371.1 hypothetical protein [Sulfitobacter sp. KE5]MDF3422852.1 hypothetical protein [Sulfitobacter sp. KE43]MDF3433917.1 hypothetical protein [Sulfitobacter sp. KE42]MDF3459557.1 hypothetical protein [Sulfitobacter sp. S74]MDF3463456.1 hypothetical protein [Sulfitobacter sp. Ks18]